MASLACHLTNTKRPTFMKKSVKYTPPSVLSWSRGQFDRRNPLGRPRPPSLGASRRASTGFWDLRQTTQDRQKRRIGSSDTSRRQFLAPEAVEALAGDDLP